MGNSYSHSDSKEKEKDANKEQAEGKKANVTVEVNIRYDHQSVQEKNNGTTVGRVEKGIKTEIDEAVRWIKHYSSSHRLLLVGEGDFSFSASLALAFENASNMFATSIDSKAFLLENYRNAMSNIEELTRRGCKVMHSIDATEMENHASLRHLTFDRIVFNFPFSGFSKGLPRNSALRRHRSLVSKFLMNAMEMIRWKGEIHITHKTNGFHNEWNLESIASSLGLRLIEAVEFKVGDYPGYYNKRGFGGDGSFDCSPSKTFKFGLEMV